MGIKTTLFSAALVACSLPLSAQNTPIAQMEHLDRGVVALPSSSSGIFVSWRYLGTDDDVHTTFDVLSNGLVVGKNISKATSYQHSGGKQGNLYQVVTKVDGVPVDTSKAVTPWKQVYLPLKLNRPAGGTLDGTSYTYSPNDMSVGDVDGDGQYELFVKWDPSNAKDNSQSGVTGNVIIDCYKLDGTQLWRVDLGRNIRAGAHYTQYLVYDFDGDGHAEMMCKTAPGSKDGAGAYVNQAATDSKIKAADNNKSWVVGGGRINGGHEYLTVFEGLTGKAIHTIAYNPTRNASSGLSEAAGTFNWDDRSGKNDKGDYGNRGERYLACVAALDGSDGTASGVFGRGYYTFAYLWAVDFDGKQLKPRWLHKSGSRTTYSVVNYQTSASGSTKSYTPGKSTSGGGSNTLYANGNHNISVADVDGDGKDEIIYGSAAVDDDGKLLYAVGFGHGDAMHLGDLNPERPGLEVFDVHEEKGTYSWDLHDAATGQVLLKGGNSGVDNGRGIAAQLDANHYGCYFSSADQRDQRSAVTGKVMSSGQTSLNFRIFWDGDLQEELLDGTKIDKWNGNGTSRLYINGKNPYDYNSSSSCNGTKSTPNLQADIFGDWREEIILWNSSDGATINIFSSNMATDYRVPTLMHDHTYRMAVAWQNCAYNQPPHLGYYLPDLFRTKFVPMNEFTMEQTVGVGDSINPLVFLYRNCTSVNVDSTFTPTEHIKGLDKAFTIKRDYLNHLVTITGKPEVEGDYEIVLRGSGNAVFSGNAYQSFMIHVTSTNDIVSLKKDADADAYYNLQGIRLEGVPTVKGIYIHQGKKLFIK
ncbi:MAG: rhamnogalacturonan lyase [Bacteroidaceae bacterium]|nr:rhamnogalacturonan lyase [Bacteroidaceae bacterium]